MKKQHPVNAAVAWSTLGLKWMETLAASGQVIARRTTRANTPAQLFGMGSEKVEAAIESSNAMTRKLVGLRSGDAFQMLDAWAGILMSGLAPYHSRASRNARAVRRGR